MYIDIASYQRFNELCELIEQALISSYYTLVTMTIISDLISLLIIIHKKLVYPKFVKHNVR